MSAAHVQALAERLDASQVYAEAQSAAAEGDRAAGVLVRVVQLLGAQRGTQLSRLESACASLLHERRLDPDWQRDQPWPWSSTALRAYLLGSIAQSVKADRGSRLCWSQFLSIQHGARWLVDAARLSRRDGHVMRHVGGLYLAPSAFDGERLRAEIVPAERVPGAPRSDVLRITWEDTGRLVAQSLPGRFGDVDMSADPE